MKTTFISVALIIILGFVVYGNSLDGGFLWDDGTLISDNEYIRSWVNVPKIFAHKIGRGGGEESNSYRPLQILTYTLDYSLWKLNVRGYHLTNIALHILAALALYWLARVLSGNKILPLLASIFFVAHPIHTEAVAYISGRADPLATLFMLLSLVFYIKYLRLNKSFLYIFALLGYVLALLSRENSLILPLLFLLYHYAFKENLKIRKFLPIIIITFIYVLLRMAVFKSSPSNVGDIPSLSQRMPGFFVAITNYVRLLFLPFNLHMEYGTKLFTFAQREALLGILLLSAPLIYAFRKRDKDGLAFFAIAWFFVALLPYSNIYLLNAYMAEHWLYLPSIGFFLVIANILTSIYRIKYLKTLTVGVAVMLLVFYSYLTKRQNEYWREPLYFYERTSEYASDSSRVYYNLGNLYSRTGRKKEAIRAYKRATDIDPTSAVAHYNLGNVYIAVGNNEEAIASYKKAIEIDPNDPKIYNNLGVLYKTVGKIEDAVSALRKAIEVSPNHASAYKNLAVIYRDEGKRNLAFKYYDKAIKLGYKADPEFRKSLD